MAPYKYVNPTRNAPVQDTAQRCGIEERHRQAQHVAQQTIMQNPGSPDGGQGDHNALHSEDRDGDDAQDGILAKEADVCAFRRRFVRVGRPVRQEPV